MHRTQLKYFFARTSLARASAATAALAMILGWAGCGNTFRPVEIPLNPPGQNPQQENSMVVLSRSEDPANPGACVNPFLIAPCPPGATSQLDVSGDSIVADVYVGLAPAFVLYIGNIFVANQAPPVAGVPQFGTVSEFLPTTPGIVPSTFNLTASANAQPVFMDRAGFNIYVADLGVDMVTVIDTETGNVPAILTVGNKPVALASTSDNSKVYVINQADNTASVISALDNTVSNTISLAGSGTDPVLAVANPTATEMYVLNSATPSVSVINTFNDQVIGTLALPANGASNYMTFNAALQRLYVTNPGPGDGKTCPSTSQGSVSVFDASPAFPALPNLLATVCNLGLAPTPAATSPAYPNLAPLPDGSRVYVISTAATVGCSGEANSGQMQIINTSTNTVVGCITVGSSPAAIAPSSDSSRIYIVHLGQGVSGFTPPVWAANRAFGVGAQITDSNGNVQQVLLPGTSGSAQPVWATAVTAATADGTITWTNAGLTRGTTIVSTALNQVVSDLLPPYVDPNCFTNNSICVLMSPVTVVTGP